MRVLLMEKNLLILSRISSSLKGYEIKADGQYGGEEVVLINLEQFPPETIKQLKEKGARVIAYCGHKNVELMKKAKDSGADMVVPNSQIVQAGRLIEEL